VEKLLDLPVLAAVPEMGRPVVKKNAPVSPDQALAFQLPMLADGNSPPAEAIRSLRASMSLIGVESERRSLIFTSALPGEGKSFTAANYSIALASQELRTLLIDADLRRPSVHTMFGAERGHLGAVDYFLNEEPLESFVTTTSLQNLDLLLSGTSAPNPAELLSGQGFTRLIAEAMQSYDRIVVDTAPINVVSDTLMLIKCVQSVCVVVRAASSPSEAVLRAVRVMEKSGKRPVGVVFNRVPRHAGLGYHANYYYHYGPADRYGSGYGALPT
jgi:capsular exopolysaccharide synthesis family protein